jgi:hypothetical protein
MSENMTPAQGSGPLSVDSAAEALLGLMGDSDSLEQPQSAPEEPEQQEAAAEDYSDEPTGEAEQESEAQEESEEQPEQPKYRVKAAGEEREVTLDELIRGYQLEADYTKKTQSLAEERKTVESEKARIAEANQLRDQYSQRLQMVEQMLSQQPQENLEALKETDPIGYAVKVAEQQQKEKQLQVVQAERFRIAQMQQAEQAEAISKHVATEAEKLAQALPEYADKEKGETVRKELRSFAKSVGWTDQELSSVYDSRAVLTLYKAMQYDKLMSGKAEVNKKVADAPRMLKGSASTQRSPDQEQVRKQKQQLKSSGRVADAAKVFERFI